MDFFLDTEAFNFLCVDFSGLMFWQISFFFTPLTFFSDLVFIYLFLRKSVTYSNSFDGFLDANMDYMVLYVLYVMVKIYEY